MAHAQGGREGITTLATQSTTAADSDEIRWSVPTTFRLQPYGSNANFNPLSMLLNRGFDMWQIDQFSPNLFTFPFGRTAGAVWDYISHPAREINEYGPGKFWKTQVLPLKFSQDRSGNPAWLGNYNLHFFQGGVTFVRTEGWLADRGWPAPRLWSGVFTMTAAYLTEMTEVTLFPGYAGATTVADLWLFDLGGVLAFNIPLVRNFVGEKMEVLDWSLQPIITTHGELNNAGDYFAIRLGLPGLDRTKFILRAGIGSWAGLSFQRNDSDAISVLIGGETLTRDIDLLGDESITLGISGGVFYDRNGSLLAGLEWGTRERLLSANIYPGVLPGLLGEMGMWFSVDRKIRPRFGIIAGRVGLGVGYTPPRNAAPLGTR
jgi:hypothetical protein